MPTYDKLIEVNQKHVHIIDADGLRAIVSGQNPEPTEEE